MVLLYYYNYYYCMSSGYVAVTTGHAVECHLLNCRLRLYKYASACCYVLVDDFNIFAEDKYVADIATDAVRLTAVSQRRRL